MFIFFYVYKCAACWILKLSTSSQIKTQNMSSSLAAVLVFLLHYCCPPKGYRCPELQKHGSVWPVFVLMETSRRVLLCSSVTGSFCLMLFLWSSSCKCRLFILIDVWYSVVWMYHKWSFKVAFSESFCCSLEALLTLVYTDFYRQ